MDNLARYSIDKIVSIKLYDKVEDDDFIWLDEFKSGLLKTKINPAGFYYKWGGFWETSYELSSCSNNWKEYNLEDKKVYYKAKLTINFCNGNEIVTRGYYKRLKEIYDRIGSCKFIEFKNSGTDDEQIILI